MTCIVKLYETPELTNPILIEGLPGIGLVANLATLHLIKELGATLFGEIVCSSFHDVAITSAEGEFRFPTCKLYYHKEKGSGRDLVLLYGDTQALTTRGQYELCGKILELAGNMGCRLVITIGGYRPGREVREPKLYYAASDLETAQEAANLRAQNLTGRIFGIAGLLIGLCKLHEMKGFCLLAETPGDHPDKAAAREVLKTLTQILGFNLDLNRDIVAVDEMSSAELPEPEAHAYRRDVAPEWFI